MGTPAFAVPSLERIVAAGHDVVAVFTQPDRPQGRSLRVAMPAVKEAALRLRLAVYQPERVRRPEVVEQLRGMAPEAMVVVGYGQIIPKTILDIPPMGIVNVHASLLPKYRRCADSVGHRARRNAHRCHYDADQRGARHRRHAAQMGDGDRRGGDGGRTRRAPGGGWRGPAGAYSGRVD